MKILLIGGGIGGLTTALSLARAGHQIQLFEQMPAFSEVGAGLQLSPNASRILIDLGLGDALQAFSFLPIATHIRHWQTGKLISDSPLGETALKQFGSPYYHIHRADLLKILLEAIKQQANIELTCSARITEINIGKNPSIKVNDRNYYGDCCIGADGIHSAVRQQLFGDQAPRFTGNVAWRALVPTDSLPDNLISPTTSAWWGPNKHFVHYYVRQGHMVNCVCVVEKSDWHSESWNETGDKQELIETFSNWHESIQTLLRHTDETQCFKWALFDRAPLPSWSKENVTLLGDACHPTLPFMAQGAAMAIEDAAILTRCLGHYTDISMALRQYEKMRKQRTSRIQKGSRRNAKIFHLSGLQAWARDKAVKQAGKHIMDWLYEYDALSVPIE